MLTARDLLFINIMKHQQVGSGDVSLCLSHLRFSLPLSLTVTLAN